MEQICFCLQFERWSFLIGILAHGRQDPWGLVHLSHVTEDGYHLGVWEDAIQQTRPFITHRSLCWSSAPTPRRTSWKEAELSFRWCWSSLLMPFHLCSGFSLMHWFDFFFFLSRLKLLYEQQQDGPSDLWGKDGGGFRFNDSSDQLSDKVWIWRTASDFVLIIVLITIIVIFFAWTVCATLTTGENPLITADCLQMDTSSLIGAAVVMIFIFQAAWTLIND